MIKEEVHIDYVSEMYHITTKWNAQSVCYVNQRRKSGDDRRGAIYIMQIHHRVDGSGWRTF